MKDSKIEHRNYMLILSFIMIPYLFLSPIEVNFTLFDFFLVIAGVKSILFNKITTINKKNIRYYAAAYIFIMLISLPLFRILNSSSYFIVIVQYTFILLWMFPLILETLDMNTYRLSIIYMCRLWSLFMVLNLSLLSMPSMYIARRFTGYYSNPGTLGLMIVVIVPFLIESISLETRFIFKALSFLGSISSLVLLMATGSRAGLVALLIGMLIYFILKYGISLSFIKKILPLLLIFILVSFVFIDDFERNVLTRISSFENIETRTRDYQIARKVLNQNFLFGTGLQNSSEMISLFGGEYRPHNFFLAYFVETGLLGLMLISYIITISVLWSKKFLYSVFLKSRKIDGIVSATISSALILLTASQFSTPTVHRGFWVFWALALWISREYEGT